LVSALYTTGIRTQFDDGVVNASCFAVIMLLNVISGAEFLIVDSMVSLVGNSDKNYSTHNPVSETHLSTEKATIV
jgi:hypothetical protein